MTANEPMLDKIAKLLSMAESTTHEDEADAFISKAQALMQEYQIDRAQLAARGTQRDEQVVQVTIQIAKSTPGRAGRTSLLNSIAKSNRCRFRYSTDTSNAYIVGHETDVAYVLKLYAYLERQMFTEMLFAMANSDEQQRTFKANFTIAFANRIWQRLRKMQPDYAPVEGSSQALVLVGKEKRVDLWMEKNVGPLRTIKSYYSPSADGTHAGDAAGRKADLNPTKGLTA